MFIMITLQDCIGRGIGVHRRHVYGCVVGLCHAGQDQAVHAMKQGVGVTIMAVQQIVEVVGMIWVIWWEIIRVLLGAGQLAVVAEVVKVFVVLLNGACGREAGTGAVMLPGIGNGKDMTQQHKWRQMRITISKEKRQ